MSSTARKSAASSKTEPPVETAKTAEEIETEAALAEAEAAQKAADEETAAKRSAALTEAYGAATKRLREAHLPEFNQLRVEEATKRGYEWTPKPTADEKAADQLAKLLAEHPSLRDQFAGTTGDVPEPQ